MSQECKPEMSFYKSTGCPRSVIFPADTINSLKKCPEDVFLRLKVIG
jgi:hypothetical protein